MNTSVKFVYCDIGGVLFDESGTNSLLKEFGIDPKLFRRARAKYLKASLTGEITANELLQSTLHDIGLATDIKDYNDYWASHSKPYSRGQRTLSIISKHYSVGLITNNMKGSLPYYKKYGLYPDLNYRQIVESSKLGFKKPDKRIYDYAEKKVGIKSGAIFLVDDRQGNLDATRKVGWQTILFDKENQEASSEQILNYLGLK